MANILYGVNGEGSGHSTRSREVIRHLQARGHAVHVASFDRGLQNLRGEFEVTEIDGLRFSAVENRVRYGRTVLKNLFETPRLARALRALRRRAEEWKIDLVCTDFEPLSYRAARHLGLPAICIDNQGCLTRAEVEYPKKYRRDAIAAKLAMRAMVPRASAYLFLTFFPAEIKRPDSFAFPPILRREVLEARPATGEHVVVYVTNPSERLIDTLKRVRCRFLCYGFGREGESGSVTLKKPSAEGFLSDLVTAQAVIANAGFSLISEALHLGKPYLAWPLERQFEQIFNAYYVDKTGYGAYWDELDKERVESFLFNLDAFRENLRRYPRQDNSALFAKLDQLIAGYTGIA